MPRLIVALSAVAAAVAAAPVNLRVWNEALPVVSVTVNGQLLNATVALNANAVMTTQTDDNGTATVQVRTSALARCHARLVTLAL